MGFGAREIVLVLIVLAIVLLVFGPKRIKSLGSELGSAIKGFRSAVRDKDAPDDSAGATAHAATDAEPAGNAAGESGPARK